MSSFEVLSSHLLEDRLLRLLLLVLVRSGEFVFSAMTDELRSSEKLDVRLLRGRDEFDAFGLWGVCCPLGGVLVVWLEVLATWGVVRDVSWRPTGMCVSFGERQWSLSEP